MLLIHLKRFSFKGPFTDKIEKHIDFPLKGLDLTNYMPPPLPPGVDRKGTQTYLPEDPRLQIPPYRYDLYAVTNHFGSLSSGHCTVSRLAFCQSIDHVMRLDTAFIASRGGWLYCDDSRVTPANPKEVVVSPCIFFIAFFWLIVFSDTSGQASICPVLQAGEAMKRLRP